MFSVGLQTPHRSKSKRTNVEFLSGTRWRAGRKVGARSSSGAPLFHTRSGTTVRYGRGDGRGGDRIPLLHARGRGNRASRPLSRRNGRIARVFVRGQSQVGRRK